MFRQSPVVILVWLPALIRTTCFHVCVYEISCWLTHPWPNLCFQWNDMLWLALGLDDLKLSPWKEGDDYFDWLQFSSVQFSPSVVFDSLRPHESQHARSPCPSPTPGVHSDSRPSSQWCHPAISSSVVPFSSCPQSLPASESFPRSQLFAWGGQSTGVSALASFLPKKSQGWSPSEWTGWNSFQSKGLPTQQFKSISSAELSLLHRQSLTSIHEHRKNHSLD